MTTDEILLEEVEPLLIGATPISVDDVSDSVHTYGGFCYPAHIDRPSFSILAALGYLPEYLTFGAVEVSCPQIFLTKEHSLDLQKRY